VTPFTCRFGAVADCRAGKESPCRRSTQKWSAFPG
jgi:hypothetical protein